VKKDYADCPKCRKNRIILRGLILIIIFVGVFVCGMVYANSFSG
jgi:t-SNARE complex subunit (syntaxin)